MGQRQRRVLAALGVEFEWARNLKGGPVPLDVRDLARAYYDLGRGGGRWYDGEGCLFKSVWGFIKHIQKTGHPPRPELIPALEVANALQGPVQYIPHIAPVYRCLRVLEARGLVLRIVRPWYLDAWLVDPDSWEKTLKPLEYWVPLFRRRLLEGWSVAKVAQNYNFDAGDVRKILWRLGGKVGREPVGTGHCHSCGKGLVRWVANRVRCSSCAKDSLKKYKRAWQSKYRLKMRRVYERSEEAQREAARLGFQGGE